MKDGGKAAGVHKKGGDSMHRIGELESELEGARTLSEAYKSQLTYLQADYENLQKRVERDYSERVKCANESLVFDLLPVLDSLDCAVEKTWGEDSEGLERLRGLLCGILEKHGLKPIHALGACFDPYYHEALAKEKSDASEDVILAEIQKGYTLNGRVVRHSKVKISGGV
jgi:molecular chaperone GrpE